MAPRLLLDSEMGQQGGVTIGGRKATMVQMCVLAKVDLNNMAVG